MNILRFIGRNMRQHRGLFVVIFIVAFLNGIGVFLIPITLGEFTKPNVAADRYPFLLALVVGIYAVGLGLQWVIRKYGEAAVVKTETESLVRLYHEYEDVPIGDLTKHHSGHVLSLMNRLTDSVVPLLMDSIWSLTSSLPQIILFFWFTAQASLGLAILNTGLLLIFFGFGTWLSRGQIPRAKKYNLARAAFMERFVDFLTNMHTVRKLGLSTYTAHVLSERVGHVSGTIDHLQAFHAMRWFFLHLVSGAVFLATLGTIAWRVGHGSLPVASLIIFISAYLFIRGTIDRATENIRRLMSLQAYLDSLSDVLNQAVPRHGEPLRDWQDVVLTDIAFQYAQHHAAITVPSFHLRRGDRICVVGTSGEGKSTFLNIIAGFLEPQSGTRLIDGRTFAEIDIRTWQERIAFVSQEVEIFNASLRENLTLGQAVDDRQLHELLDELDLAAWLKTLPQGLDTVVGEKGVRLSSGQKQRLNLARSIILNRELYLLDEPISHLDAATAQHVIACIRHRLSEKTVVIVTHHDVLRELATTTYVVTNHVVAPEVATT